MSCPLLLLPNELLHHIITILAPEPPSLAQFYLTPNVHLVRSEPQHKSLKHLALTSSQLLDLVRPILFSHACLELKDELDFRTFLVHSNLNRYVTSLVAISPPTPVYSDDPSWWRRVLRYLDPDRITLLAPPVFIGETLDASVQGGFNWAFEIDLQILQLERDPCPARDLSSLPILENCTNLLTARPWTSMAFNESSSLKAYHHYEYFLGRVPSFIGEWGFHLQPQALSPQEHSPGAHSPQFDPEPPALPGLTTILENFVSFSYIAVFPFFNHIELILNAIFEMNNLQQLTIQMAPDANNHATELEQRGSLDPNDPWMELESAYSIIGWHVDQHPSIVEFCSRDLHVEAVREDLIRVLQDNMSTNWTSDGTGIWRRNLPPIS